MAVIPGEATLSQWRAVMQGEAFGQGVGGK